MSFKILITSMTVSFLLILIVVVYIKFYWKTDKKESNKNLNFQNPNEGGIGRFSAKNSSSHSSLKFSKEPFIPGVSKRPEYLPNMIRKLFRSLNSRPGDGYSGSSGWSVHVKEVSQSWIEEGVDRSGLVISFRYFYEDEKDCNYGVKLGTIDLVDGYHPLEDIPSCFIIRWKVKTVIVDGKAQIYPSETWYHDKERTCTDKEIDFSKFKIPIKDPESTMQIIFLFEFIDQ